jgi:hypothetical protein
MSKRRFHLGIDYGTYASKLVFRDFEAAGGEKAYAVKGKQFRIPSAVGITLSELIFGQNPSDEGRTWIESLKMRLAGAVKGDYKAYFCGPLVPLPPELSEKALATLTVWYLISQGHHAVTGYVASSTRDFNLGITLGIPTSFFNDQKLTAAFLDVARTAYELYRGHGPLKGGTISRGQAAGLFRAAEQAVRSRGSIGKDDLRDWIRTEAEAALLWPFLSPSVADGPYAKVDVGAGTTNASFFRIAPTPSAGRWLKDRVVFFGACSAPVGMDSVDEALASHTPQANGNWLRLRGQEEVIMQDPRAAQSAAKVFARVLAARLEAWQRAVPKLLAPAEQEAWRNHKVFIIGGGSTLKPLCSYLDSHSVSGDHHWKYEQVALEQPDDLYLGPAIRVLPEHMPFVSVAHGLSYPALAIPEVDLPRDVQPMKYATPEPKRYKRWQEEPDDWRTC